MLHSLYKEKVRDTSFLIENAIYFSFQIINKDFVNPN